MASGHVITAGRRRRHRAKALLLTSLGWVICAVPAVLFVTDSWLGPLGVLVTGSVLLLLCARAEGDVPLAAIGVGAMGALAMALATVALAGGVPFGLAASFAAFALAAPTWLWALSSASPSAPGPGPLPTLAAWAVLLLLSALAFPGSERTELAVLELAPAEPERSLAPADGPAPTALARAPAHGPRAPLEVAPSGPTLRTATRHLTATPHRGAIWLVGLFLVAVGSLAGLQALGRLRALRGARHARRTAHGYVLEDGQPVELEPPSAAPRVVVRARPEGGYRGSAVPRAQLLGEGELAALVRSLRERAFTIALGTLVTTAAAWLPLIALG